MNPHAFQEPFGRVVVAFGQEMARSRALTALRRAGYRAEAAADGVAALASLAGEPSVLLLDLHLPRIDGFSVIATVLGEPPARRPVVIPASDRLRDGPDLRALVKDLGASPLLRLPTTDVNLVGQVRAFVGGPQEQRGGPRHAYRQAYAQIQHELRLPCTVRWSNREQPAELVSVGGDGGCVVAREPAPAGTAVAVRFRIPGFQDTVALAGRVDWVSASATGPGHVGVAAFVGRPYGTGADAYHVWRQALRTADPEAGTASPTSSVWDRDIEAERLDRARSA